jgi:acetyl-CoA C-acetyltransferase
MSEAWIIDACRTPRGIGKQGKGALADLHPQHLGAAVLKALKERNDLDTSVVDDIIFGTSLQSGTQGGDLARMAALTAGYSTKASGVTLDRYCGSGITAAALGASVVASGFEDVIVSGGCEMMSTYGANRHAPGIGLLDMGNEELRAAYFQPHQGVAADAIASMDGISREALDQLGYESQQRAAVAIAESRFDRSLVPVYSLAGELLLDHEEYPRPSTTLERLASLEAAFGGFMDFPLDESGVTMRSAINAKYPDIDIQPVHHAGTSSGVVDGAAAILFASDRAVADYGWKPRARVVATANVGDDPTLMLNAPGPAIRKVLAKAGLTIDDIDTFEINEAFAVVVEKAIRDLGLDRSKVNPNGGAIALGHPIGATGSILIGTALDELERTGGRYGLITQCAAGGMAPAVIIERV